MSAGDWLVPLFFLVALPALIVNATSGLRGLRPAAALMRRRLQVYTSYPFAVFATLANALIVVLVIIALGRHLFPEFRSFEVEAGRDSVNLIVFATVGLIAWPAVWEGYELAHRNIRTEQTTGMFETLLATPVGVRVLPMAYLMINLPVAIVVATTAYFLFTHYGGIVFPIDSAVLVLNLVLVLTTGVVMTWALGLFLGALTTLYKEIGPVGGILKLLMLVFSGIYLPLGIFPPWIQVLSNLLPLTWAFASIRGVFGGVPITGDMRTYLVFLAYTLALVIAGLWAFGKSIERARKDGTAGGY